MINKLFLFFILNFFILSQRNHICFFINRISNELAHSAQSFRIVLLCLRKSIDSLCNRTSWLLVVPKLIVWELSKTLLHMNIFNLILLKICLVFYIVFFNGILHLKVIEIVFTWDHNCVLVWAQSKHVVELFRINAKSLVWLSLLSQRLLNDVAFYVHAGPIYLHGQGFSKGKRALNGLYIFLVLVLSPDESYLGLRPDNSLVVFGVVFLENSSSRYSVAVDLIHYKKPKYILNAILA